MKFMPVLSFPVAKKLGYKTSDFVRSADAQVEVCDIPLHAPWTNLDAFFAAVKTYRTE